MSLNAVPAGKNLPDEINVIIEIPAHADPVKYEVDKDSGAIFVDRFMATCMHYPTNYGYVPHTLSLDGDPVDVLVLTPFPLMAGCVIRCRPVGVLKMTDESGEDAKVLAVPADKLSTIYRGISEIDQVPELTKQQIEHFFKHYKDLEPNKWVKIEGWGDSKDAKAEITDSVTRYEQAEDKPAF
ncbi:inorganic diphosphatase [Aliiglaciecola litoralis]|uniref:Inorganic pyrophosphatase n=1 Tax=Aliiglaciecola litoralis TaxID=582857 RepID=A0ABN1LIA8_9ALTE